MRKLFLLLCVVSVLPCQAGKNRQVIDVTEGLNYRKICKQNTVLQRYPNQLEKEGLSHLTSSSPSSNDEEWYISPRPDQYIISIGVSAELDEELIKEFNSRKRREMGGALTESLAPFGCDMFLALFSGCSGYLGPLGGGMALLKAMTGARDFSQNVASGGMKMYNLEGDPLYPYEIAYVLKKRFLPSELQTAIEDRFSGARQDSKALTDSLQGFFPIVQNLPIHSYAPNPHFEKEIIDLTSGYITAENIPLSKRLNLVATAQYSRFMEKAGPNPSQRQVIYLQGEPGIGKTFIARSLAKALGLPLYEMSLSGGSTKFFGDKQNPGDLLQVFAREGSALNGIVFLDEANHVLNQGFAMKGTGSEAVGKFKSDRELGCWLSLLDPETKALYLPFLGAEIDISHVLLIVAGNELPQNEAILNRMKVVKITGLKKRFKEKVVFDKILPNLLASENSRMALSIEDIGGQNAIQGILSKDQDPGFRSIKDELEILINTVRLQRLSRNGYTSAPSKSVFSEHYSAYDKKKE